MLPITKKLIRYNFSSRNKQRILYIVIHDTGNPRAGANAEAHFRYFNGGNRGASAHYFVDDGAIIQTVEDYIASWHCGDGRVNTVLPIKILLGWKFVLTKTAILKQLWPIRWILPST